MSRAPVRIALLTVLCAASTWGGGWWAVPLVGALWPVLKRGAPAWEAGVAGFLAWVLLLGVQAPLAPTLALARRLAGVFGIPAAALLLVTPVFAGLLGWSAAEFTAGIFPRREISRA